MRRLLPVLVVAIGISSSGCDARETNAPSAGAMSGEFVTGYITLPEISGARVIGGKVIVVADDAVDEDDDIRQYHMVASIAIPRLLAGGKIEVRDDDHRYRQIIEHLDPRRLRSDLITDLEAVASDDRYVYLLSSHSRSQRDNYPAKRRRLARIVTDGDRISSAEFSPAPLERIIPAELIGSTDRRPGEVDLVGNPNPGFNIEGMAASPGGDLLFGLRSPLIDGNAVILAANKESLWRQDHEHELELRHLLDLGGLGIRAIERDDRRSGYWLIAGSASDVDSADNPWSIWFWSDDGALTRRWTHTDAPSEIRNPEALAMLPDDGSGDHLLVVSDNSDRRPSTYILIPIHD
jgi:hypothetical protein